MNLHWLASKLDNDNYGQTLYVVDSDYRTLAQGWSKSDQTGPLDLVGQRNPGYVHYTPGGLNTQYGTDAAALQGAIDYAVDFRGDKLYLTPGSYSIATALSMDCPGLRVMGPPVRHPKSARVTVTATIASAYSLTAAADDMEIAHHKIVPLTAAKFLDVTAGADRAYLHDLFYDATGVAASTSTEFCNAAAALDWLVERCVFYVDAAQGDAFTLASPQRWVFQDNDFMVGLTTVAWASVFTFATSALGMVMRRNLFRGCGGATAAVFTNIVTGIANVNGQLMMYQNFVDGTALATGTAIETTFGTATDIELAENFQTGDASGEGGVVIALA
jgi:hypothetical protein